MGHLDIFKRFSVKESLFEVFTVKTHHGIPSTPGCYAWFLPLWVLDDDFSKWLELISRVLHYDTHPKHSIPVEFGWDRVDLQVERRTNSKTSQRMQYLWNRFLSNDKDRNQLQKTLLEASLLLPPLYVGRTDNLNQRYHQHVHPDNNDRNTFNRRFTVLASEIGLSLSVNELLFACIEMSEPQQDIIRSGDEETQFNHLIEYILMHLSHPPFSER